jgi:putative peptidoglycan lipid II flippase
MLNRFLGVGREVLTAAFFGSSAAMDAFNLAFTVVTSMRQFFAEQFLTPIIPTFFQRRQEGGETAAVQSLRYITTRLNLISIGICVVIFIGSKQIIRWIAPGFQPEQVHLAGTLIRWFAVGGVGFILHRYYSGIYMCFFRYTMISFAPLLMNIGAILAMIFFAAQYGVISLAAGFSLGFLAFFLLQAAGIPHRREILSPRWGKGDPGVRLYAILLAPLFISVFTEQIQLFIDRSLASGLPAGALSAQGYALRLIRTSSDIWLGTFGVAVFPIFSELAAKEQREELARHFSLALQAVILFLFMTGAVMISLALPTVRILLERGEFTAQDSLVTARLLVYYTVAYIAQAFVVVIVRGLHAHKDTRRPMLATMISVAIMILFDFILIRPMGISGLALATAIGYSTNMILVYLFFSKHLTPAHTRNNLKIALLAFALVLPIGWLMKTGWSHLEEAQILVGFFAQLAGLVLFTATGTGLYILALRLLHIEAYEYAYNKIKTKLISYFSQPSEKRDA